MNLVGAPYNTMALESRLFPSSEAVGLAFGSASLCVMLAALLRFSRSSDGPGVATTLPFPFMSDGRMSFSTTEAFGLFTISTDVLHIIEEVTWVAASV